MKRQELVVFYEGVKDKILLENVIRPLQIKTYNKIKYVPYSQKRTNESLAKEIHVYDQGAKDYLLFADNVKNNCVSFVKNELINKIPNISRDKIIVVVVEIESWYLAGIDNATCTKWGIRYVHNTNTTTKEQFEEIVLKHPKAPVIPKMLQIAKHFNTYDAIKRNISFKYFCKKYLEIA